MASIFFLWTCGSPALGKVPEIRVSASPNPVSQGENVSLKISVRLSSTEQISAPTFQAPGFTIVGKNSSLDITTTMIGNKISPQRRNTYIYILSPRSVGKHIISDIRVRVGSGVYRASNLTIDVKKGNKRRSTQLLARQQPQQPNRSRGNTARGNTARRNQGRNNPNNNSNSSNIKVSLELSKRVVFIGEPIIAEYYVYDFNSVRGLSVKQWPTFDGFWKEDLEIPSSRHEFRSVYKDGKRMRRALLARFALYPLKVGNIAVDTLTANVDVAVRNRANNFPGFSNFTFFNFNGVQRKILTSKKDFVVVDPLPKKGRPANFTGAVGKFQFTINSSRNQVMEDEAITLKVHVQGTGNFQAIERPNIKLPPEFEIYDTETKVQQHARRGERIPLRKEKRFNTLVIPRKAGLYTIPSIEWSFFDVEEKKYKTINTRAIEIRVTENKNRVSKGPDLVEGMDKVYVEPNKEYRYLKSVEEIQSSSTIVTKGRLEKATQVLALANFLLVLALLGSPASNFIQNRFSVSPRKAKIRAAIYGLSKGRKNKQMNGRELEKAIYTYISICLQKDSSGMTNQEIREDWTKSGVGANELDAPSIEVLTQWLEDCQESQFALYSKVNRKELLKNMKTMGILLKAKLT